MKYNLNEVIFDHPSVFNTESKVYTEVEAIRLISSCVSQGSDLQKAVFNLRDSYNAVCKLTDLGFRKYAVEFSEVLLERLKAKQMYIQAYDIASRLMYHHSIVGEDLKADLFEKLMLELGDVIFCENTAKASYCKASRKIRLGLDVDLVSLVNIVEELRCKLKLESVWYHYFYYRLKVLLCKGEQLEALYNEAIDYYESLYFDHSTLKGIFINRLIEYYISRNEHYRASIMLEERLSKYVRGSGPWFIAKFTSMELYRDQGEYIKAVQAADEAMAHDNYPAQPSDYHIEWHALYDDIMPKAILQGQREVVDEDDAV